MKKVLILSILLIFFVVLIPSTVNAIPNPAATYCHELGYDYKIVDTDKGEKGVCIFPDKECEEWEFFSGICGGEYSYCTKQGYNLITKTDGKNPYSPSYSVCVYAKGPNKGNEVGSVTDLMTIGEILKVSTEVMEEEVEAESEFTITSTPYSFDWRNHNGQNWMTPVKDQGYGCGSCWAFATIGIVEAKINIYFNDPDFGADLSEQDLVSCSDAGSCDGGSLSSALNYIKNSGVVDDPCFRYTARDDPCSNRCSNWYNRLTDISDWGHVPLGETPIENTREYLIDKGPLAATLTMSGEFDPVSGVYRCTTVDWDHAHAVVITGYDNVGGYWIVKNSWGVGFGVEPEPIDGYFYVGLGECGINTYKKKFVEAPFTPISFTPIPYYCSEKYLPQTNGCCPDEDGCDCTLPAKCVDTASCTGTCTSGLDTYKYCPGTCSEGSSKYWCGGYLAPACSDSCVSASASYDPALNRDYSKITCESTISSCNPAYWSIGGEVDGTKCCQDDANEYKKTCKQEPDEDACVYSSNDDACCNSQTDCVYNNVCSPTGYEANIDDDNYMEICYNGIWYTGTLICKAIGESCTSGSECCSNYCCSNFCSSGPCCKAIGESCTSGSECCSLRCSSGICIKGGSGGGGCLPWECAFEKMGIVDPQYQYLFMIFIGAIFLVIIFGVLTLVAKKK